MSLELAMVLGTLPVLVVLFVVIKHWFKASKGDDSTSAFGNLLMYLMTAVGAYFVFHYLSTGSLVI